MYKHKARRASLERIHTTSWREVLRSNSCKSARQLHPDGKDSRNSLARLRRKSVEVQFSEDGP